MQRLTALVVGLVVASAAQAAGADTASPAPATTVLKAAHLFDGRTGTLASPGLVVIKGDRIVAVGKNAAIPPDAKVVDLGDATLVPGDLLANIRATEHPLMVMKHGKRVRMD